MDLNFWYVVDGHHIFQTRQFSLKTSLRLVSYAALKFQPQFGQLGSTKNFIISKFPQKERKLLLIVYIFINMGSFDSFHSDK